MQVILFNSVFGIKKKSSNAHGREIVTYILRHSVILTKTNLYEDSCFFVLSCLPRFFFVFQKQDFRKIYVFFIKCVNSPYLQELTYYFLNAKSIQQHLVMYVHRFSREVPVFCAILTKPEVPRESLEKKLLICICPKIRPTVTVLFREQRRSKIGRRRDGKMWWS